MNRIQKNFKSQMADAEMKLHKEAKKNRGVFSNKLFLLRFYGYDSDSFRAENKLLSFFKSCVSLIIFLLKLLFYIVFTIIFVLVVLLVVDRLSK